MPRRSRAISLGQQAEPVIEPFRDLHKRQRSHARRGELYRQWDTVQPPTGDRHCLRVDLGESKSRVDERCAIDEEPHGLRRRCQFG